MIVANTHLPLFSVKIWIHIVAMGVNDVVSSWSIAVWKLIVSLHFLKRQLLLPLRNLLNIILGGFKMTLKPINLILVLILIGLVI